MSANDIYYYLAKILVSQCEHKISMAKSKETFAPSVIICPTFDSAYNRRYIII